MIESYGNGGFVVGGERHNGSVIVTAQETFSLDIANFSDLSLKDLAPLRGVDPPVELLLIGCGADMAPVPDDLRASLKADGIVVDAMDTGAACRTYAVLLSEERRIAALLIAVD